MINPIPCAVCCESADLSSSKWKTIAFCPKICMEGARIPIPLPCLYPDLPIDGSNRAGSSPHEVEAYRRRKLTRKERRYDDDQRRVRSMRWD